ncbi:MAG TPA: tetratricopeptide repeat protein [Thermoanaerobaculia bacterium]|nr:tetratricopeptide repeat protein [Thermoanaerobaculia bacterium]
MTVRETLGHYKILGPIGSGGMGEVYVARDPKLGRKVAIKLLPTRMAAERDTLTRFTQEARSASALNHPNIVTIHEVGAEEGTPYIVMEYIEGHDLRSMIQEGPVAVSKVLDIGAQIADGLAAAHERGIVHRDLKPENIMLTRDGFAKILDFGLAKVIAPAADAGDHTLQLEVPGTTPGMILGTVGYMSPEQAAGRRLDFRSDQFAFGAILFELITGKPAFEGETAVDTLSAILHRDPPPVTRTNARAPVQLSDLIRRLLSKSADDRYSSSRDLAREIRLLRDRVAAEESGFHKSQPLIAPRQSMIAIVAAVLIAVLVTGSVMISRRRAEAPAATSAAAPTPAAAKKYLAVLRFKDLTGDATGQLVVDGFAETLTARLAHYPAVQVMRPQTPDAEKAEPLASARELGANLVLTGSMMRDGQRIRVTYTIVDAATKREWRDLIEGSVSNLFGVQDDVADSVARNLDLGETTVRIALDPAVSQRRYLEALGHLRRYDKEESLNSAIDILEELGPSPSVQAALARAYLYKFQTTRQPQLAATAGQAAERALAADPQSIDVNITLGELRRQTGRHQEAVAAFVRVLSQQPNNAEAVLGLAETYKGAGDPASAEVEYKRAIALQPNFWGGYNKLGFFYYAQGRITDAIPMFEKVVSLVPDNQRGYNNLGAMYQRLGRYDEAVRVFSDSIRKAPSGQGYSNLGTCYYFLGRYGEAAAAFEKAVELTPHDFLYWRNLGDSYRWMHGQNNKASRAYERAVTLSEGVIRVNASEVYAHASKAASLAKLGRVSEAREAILRALELEPQNAELIYEAAVISNLGGSSEETAARLQQALRLGYTAEDVLRDPEFANLRKSGTLAAIIQRSRSDQPNN